MIRFDGCKSIAVLTLSPGTRSPPRRYRFLAELVSFYDATQVTNCSVPILISFNLL